jgi:hypothetical protein
MKQPLRRLSQEAKQRLRERLIESLKGGPRTQRANREFTELSRDLAVLAADLSASAVPRHELAVQSIVAFQACVAAAEADAGVALDLSLGRQAWYSDERIVDALLRVSQRITGLDSELALRAAQTVLVARPEDEPARTARDNAETAARPPAGEEAWRTTARKRSGDTPISLALQGLAGAGSTDAAPRGWVGVEERLQADGPDELPRLAATELALAYRGDAVATKPYLGVLRSAVARGVAAGAPVAEFRGVLDATVAEMGAGPWERGTRWSGEPPAVRTINMSGLREYFAGKRVCLVANSAELLSMERGAEIDGYDVVVRFNSFAMDPLHTGSRTDVHATIHLHDFNWDVPVDVRMVFSGAPAPAWVGSIVKRLRPDAQKWVGDESVRWPRGVIMPQDLRDLVPVPTSGLNMIMLLDYLDVSTAIDLFGFNFYSGEPHRRPDAMHLPVAEAHSYAAERDWVLARAVSTESGKIALR